MSIVCLYLICISYKDIHGQELKPYCWYHTGKDDNVLPEYARLLYTVLCYFVVISLSFLADVFDGGWRRRQHR